MYKVDDVNYPISILSIPKVFTHALAMEELGPDWDGFKYNDYRIQVSFKYSFSFTLEQHLTRLERGGGATRAEGECQRCTTSGAP